MEPIKYPKYKSAVEAIEAALRQPDDVVVDKAVQMLFDAQDAEMSRGCSDVEGAFLQFRGMAGAIDYHLRKEDNISATYHMIQMFEMFKDMEENSPFSDMEIWPIKSLVIRTAKHVRKAVKNYLDPYQDYLDELLKGDKEEDDAAVKDKKTNKDTVTIGLCHLCNENEAKCKGSHLAPHFLIQSFLSYDGSQKRHTEVVNETECAGFKKERKWGRAVPADCIDEVFGRVPNDEKVVIKPSAVTRDYLFCDLCEKRFGYIESQYSESFKQHKANENGALAYIFWLSVFWRLSVGNMAIKMDIHDEKAIGAILNRIIPDNPKDATKLQPQDDMGDFHYSVFYCKNTKGELSGIVGTHAQSSPYKLLLGNYVVILYRNKSQVLPGHISNNYNSVEKWQEISFIDYWKMKQSILDATSYYELDHMGDGKDKCVDVVKGDYIDDLPSIFGIPGREMTMDDLKDRPKYSFKIPGSISKIMVLGEEHLEADTQEKRYDLIEKELGYTKEEVQEMFEYWMDHLKPKKLRKVGNKIMRENKKAARRAKQKRSKKKKNKKK